MMTTFAEIHAIADRLQAEGTDPSVRTVAKCIGNQNMGLVGAGLNEWRARNAALAEAADMPDAFRAQLELFGVALLRSAKEEGELQARVMGDEIRRLHKEARDREAEVQAKASMRDEETRAEMAELESAWTEERAALIAENEELQRRVQTLMDKFVALEANLDMAETLAANAEVAKTKAEASREAADALFADLTQTTKVEVEKMNTERAELQARAIMAERKVAVSEQLLQDAKKRIDEDAKRIDGLVADIVLIAGNKSPARRRSELPSAQA